MKNLNKILLAATLTSAITLAFEVNAADNGIAASPKAQQMLNERAAVADTPCCMSKTTESCSDKATACSTTKTTACNATTATACSTAKTTACRSATTGACCMSTTAETAANQDSVAASPKVRQLLNEHNASFTVAPLK